MAENQFIDRDNGNQNPEEDLHSLLINVMKEEFPNDPLYAAGKTRVSQTNTEKVAPLLVSVDDLELSERTGDDALDLNAAKVTYSKYKINKMLPTIDTDDLDDLLDDEWDFYVNPDTISAPRQDGLFLINKEVNLNPPDFHHEYITRGPAVIDERMDAGEEPDVVVKSTFCVFFIQNNNALPIPNYKTLEVMLVERNKTYSSIAEATPEQTKEFDLEIDGRFTSDVDGDIDPVEEFRFRQMLDRTVRWNPRVRFASGYTPGQDENAEQFFRDPGDYLLPPDMRVDGYYHAMAYQKQTYREKLREKFEGKLVALQWTIPYEPQGIEADTGLIRSDDLVFLVRMMVNGYWKQVISSNVLREYALINNIDLSSIDFLTRAGFEQVLTTGATVASGFLRGGLYGENGLINTLISNGGVTVFQDNNILDSDIKEEKENIRIQMEQVYKVDNGRVPIPGDPAYADFNQTIVDYANAIAAETKSPGWTDFSHIAEVDRLDVEEYEDYLNKYNNGGDPFNLEYLKPYEPPGSISYYPSEQVARLRQQAADQAQVDSIKKDIMELLPELAARATELDQRLSAAPANYLNYANSNLGPTSDIYRIMFSNDRFKYVKSKRFFGRSFFKQKQVESSFFRIAEKANRLFLFMNKDQEDALYYKAGTRDYTRLVKPGDPILIEMIAYLTTGKKHLINEADLDSLPGNGPLKDLIKAGGGGAAGTVASLLGTAALPAAAIGLAATALSKVAFNTLFTVDLTPRGLPFRFGMPRSLAGTRQKRLLKRNSYQKLCIATYIYLEHVRKEVSGLVNNNGHACDLFDKAIDIDNNFSEVRALVDQSLKDIVEIDNRVMISTTLGEFTEIIEDLQFMQQEFDDIDLTLFEQGEQLREQINGIVKHMIANQYTAVQYARRSMYSRNRKFFIAWPKDAIAAIENYFPGKKFDDHQPGSYK
tara:strand:+ start:419 stop:3229 length:2811 start_codon:yes stop_codon:yes gene_type:complete